MAIILRFLHCWSGMPPAEVYMLALVKARNSSRIHSKLLTPQRIKKLGRWYRRVTPVIGTCIGLIMLALILVDSISNNWAILDFCGNAAHFRTPVAKIQTSSDLASMYAFPNGYGIANLSSIGYWMNDYGIQNLATNSKDVYLITAGSFTVVRSIDFCGTFANTYTNITNPVRLGTADDAVTFFRGDAVSHAFTSDLTSNLPNSTSKMADILALGFRGARIVVDLRLTTSFYLQDTTELQNISIQFYRLHSKAYCTGCTPSMELGRGVCNLSMNYNASAQTLVVNSATEAVGTTHDMGIMIQRNVYMTLSIIFKYTAIFIAIAGYLASRKTGRWQDMDEQRTETVWHRLINAIAPKYYPHMSHAIRFDLFCYNSDIFVILYVASIVFDITNSLEYIRTVNYFNSRSSRFDVSIVLFALSTRLLWLNVFLLKLAKWLLNIVSPALYSGQSKLMPFLIFSSVTMLYLSSILLYYVPAYIEYCNSRRWYIHNNVEQLDGSFVNFFDSYYVRVLPSVVIGLLVNLTGVLVFDHSILQVLWSALQKNSLARQAIYNSSAIICEFVQDIYLQDGNFVLNCNARRLSTLQWYFVNPVGCFALPEKELVKKKGYAVTNPTTKADDAKAGQLVLHTVGQGDSGHIHLFDDNLADVKDLAFSIKILRNTSV
ncbi:unnamed protein product, partial [Aphanomyces euteiches]